MTYQPKRMRKTPYGRELVLEYRVLPLLKQHGITVGKDATGMAWRVVRGNEFLNDGTSSFTAAVHTALRVLLAAPEEGGPA